MVSFEEGTTAVVELASATRELTGKSKKRNGDDRPSGPVSWRLERRVPQEPGSGDGKTVANSGQIGRLVKASGYLRRVEEGRGTDT